VVSCRIENVGKCNRNVEKRKKNGVFAKTVAQLNCEKMSAKEKKGSAYEDFLEKMPKKGLFCCFACMFFFRSRAINKK